MIVNIMGVLLLGMKEIVVQDNDCWSGMEKYTVHIFMCICWCIIMGV